MRCTRSGSNIFVLFNFILGLQKGGPLELILKLLCSFASLSNLKGKFLCDALSLRAFGFQLHNFSFETMTFFSKHSVRLREDPIIIPWTVWLHILVLNERFNAFHQYECTPVLFRTTLGGYTATFVGDTSRTLLMLRSTQNRLRSHCTESATPFSIMDASILTEKKQLSIYLVFCQHACASLKVGQWITFPKINWRQLFFGALLQYYSISFQPSCRVLIYTCVIPA